LHHVLGFTRLGRPLRGQGGRTRLSDVFKNRRLVGGIALHGVDKVGDKVCSTLELNGNVAPCFVHSDVEGDKCVVGRPQVDADNCQKDNEDADN